MSHYFSDRPKAASSALSVDVVLPDVSFVMETDRGVFSHGHLDTGTSLLIRDAPKPPSVGRFLDLGCGSGAVALTLAARSPDALIHAVDVNERARALTTVNAARNHLHNIQVAHPDHVDPLLRFDLIWSNPPIRVGKAALHALLQTWMGRLTDDGEAVLVVQKHLGADSLQRWLTAEGFPTDRLTSKAGFRLLRVARSTSPHTS